MAVDLSKFEFQELSGYQFVYRRAEPGKRVVLLAPDDAGMLLLLFAETFATELATGAAKIFAAAVLQKLMQALGLNSDSERVTIEDIERAVERVVSEALRREYFARIRGYREALDIYSRTEQESLIGGTFLGEVLGLYNLFLTTEPQDLGGFAYTASVLLCTFYALSKSEPRFRDEIPRYAERTANHIRSLLVRLERGIMRGTFKLSDLVVSENPRGQSRYGWIEYLYNEESGAYDIRRRYQAQSSAGGYTLARNRMVESDRVAGERMDRVYNPLRAFVDKLATVH